MFLETFDFIIYILVLVFFPTILIGTFLYRKFVTIPYKNNVVKKYLLEINPNIKYTFEADSKAFQAFNADYRLINNARKYEITDLIEDENMKSFDLHATHTQSTGKSQTTVTDFKGRFYVIKIDTKYDCDFILKEEILNRAPQGFSLLDLEVISFNKKFNLYVNSREEAHHYFTPSVIKRLVELEDSSEGKLIFAYINGKFYFGINDGSNFFESLKTKEDVKNEYLRQKNKVLAFQKLIEKASL